MKGLGLFLSIMLASCGMLQLYLININSSTTSLLLGWNLLAAIGFLLGIVRYKIFDHSVEDEAKLTLIVGIILILVIIQLAMIFYLPITDLEGVLSSGFILTMMSFEEPTWFLLVTFRKRTKVDEIAS